MVSSASNTPVRFSSTSNTPKRLRSSPTPRSGKKLKKSASIASGDENESPQRVKSKTSKKVFISSDEDE